MEPEMNSENWPQPEEENSAQPYQGNYEQPSENQKQPDTSQHPEQNEPQWLQKTWCNVNVANWLQFLILIAILFVATMKIAPKFTTAQPRQQETSEYYSEYEDECYDEYYDEYYYDD